MGFSGGLAALGGLASAGGALYGLLGGGPSASNVQLPPTFNMPGMGEAAGNALSGINSLQPYTDLGSSALPYAQSTFQGLYNNPYSGGYQQGAGVASNLGQNAALGGYGVGSQLAGAGLATLPYAQQIMQTGMDPQSALYNRTLQQVQDQTRAGLEARGVDSTPYGAGIEGQTLSNFNIDWQNNLLNRQAQAAGAAGGLIGQGAGVANTGVGIANQAPGQYLSASAMPYATSTGILGGQNQALSSMLGIGGAGQALAQPQIQDYLSYIGAGNQAGGVANNTASLALAQQNAAFQQQQQLGQALGGSLYGLGRAANGWGGFGGGYNGPFGNIGYGTGVGAYGPIPAYR